VKSFLRTGGSGLVLVIIMFVGGLGLWVGVPVGWLYLGSLVQGATNSLGTALAVMFAGSVLSIAVLVFLLGRLNRLHAELRERRGLEDHGNTPLEAVMTVSATVAIIGFAVWFFLFSGSSPVPTGLGF
jgi:heme/copper-type cytochrome/quinol oxidase subunit 2